MRKIILVLISVLLLASCAVAPEANGVRTLYVVGILCEYRNTDSALKTVNNTDVIEKIENLYKEGHTGFDEIKETLFVEEKGEFSIRSSVSDTGKVSRWTLNDDIIPAIKDIAEEADPDDLLIFMYSGHGVVVSNIEEVIGSFCIPAISESSSTDLADNIELWMPDAFIDLMDTVNCNKLAFLLSCASGAVNEHLNGTLAGTIISGETEEEITTHFSVSSAISEAFSLQFGSCNSGNGRMWMIAASESDQESFSFILDEEKNLWDPFIDYIVQSIDVDETSDEFTASGSDKLTVTDIFNHIVDLSSQPIVEAAVTIPENYKDSLVQALGDRILFSVQTANRVKTPVDLVIFRR